jgi:branched-chain amino acid transport system permease protein
MPHTAANTLIFVLILAIGLVLPLIFPAYTFQIAVLYLMVVFALTWDIMGGQMGYNSLGNIFFFGAGMYVWPWSRSGCSTTSASTPPILVR